MAAVMHIVREWLTTPGEAPARAYCGKTLRRGTSRDAALCERCRQAAGWTHDKRH